MKIAVFGLIFLSALALAKDRDWKIGKVLDSNSARSYLQTGATTTVDSSTIASGTAVTSGNVTTASVTGTTFGSASTQIHNTAVQSTQLLIVGDEYSYLVNDSVLKPVGLPTHGIVTRTIANRKRGCRFVIGDRIDYSQEKGSLWIRDADTKECKLDIIRQERIQRAPNH